MRGQRNHMAGVLNIISRVSCELLTVECLFCREPVDGGEVLRCDGARVDVRLRPHDRLAHLRTPLRHLQPAQVREEGRKKHALLVLVHSFYTLGLII